MRTVRSNCCKNPEQIVYREVNFVRVARLHNISTLIFLFSIHNEIHIQMQIQNVLNLLTWVFLQQKLRS